jgi:UDP-N-acetylenolpyruvoylglucosamine reductase
VNHGKETKASEVNTFAKHIIDIVYKKTGILLEQEVQFVE